jgi:cell wall-associated NlpC family hydrolase
LDISKYIGKQYRHRGEGQSFDCLSLVISVLNDNGYNLPYDDGRPIGGEWYIDNPDRLIEGLSQYGKRITPDQLQPLDVVVFSFRGIPRHAGIMIDRSHMIHARQGKDVAVIRLKHYIRFFHSAWRMRGE